MGCCLTFEKLKTLALAARIFLKLFSSLATSRAFGSEYPLSKHGKPLGISLIILGYESIDVLSNAKIPFMKITKTRTCNTFNIYELRFVCLFFYIQSNDFLYLYGFTKNPEKYTDLVKTELQVSFYCLLYRKDLY